MAHRNNELALLTDDNSFVADLNNIFGGQQTKPGPDTLSDRPTATAADIHMYPGAASQPFQLHAMNELNPFSFFFDTKRAHWRTLLRKLFDTYASGSDATTLEALWRKATDALIEKFGARQMPKGVSLPPQLAMLEIPTWQWSNTAQDMYFYSLLNFPRIAKCFALDLYNRAAPENSGLDQQVANAVKAVFTLDYLFHWAELMHFNPTMDLVSAKLLGAVRAAKIADPTMSAVYTVLMHRQITSAPSCGMNAGIEAIEKSLASLTLKARLTGAGNPSNSIYKGVQHMLSFPDSVGTDFHQKAPTGYTSTVTPTGEAPPGPPTGGDPARRSLTGGLGGTETANPPGDTPPNQDHTGDTSTGRVESSSRKKKRQASRARRPNPSPPKRVTKEGTSRQGDQPQPKAATDCVLPDWPDADWPAESAGTAQLPVIGDEAGATPGDLLRSDREPTATVYAFTDTQNVAKHITRQKKTASISEQDYKTAMGFLYATACHRLSYLGLGWQHSRPSTPPRRAGAPKMFATPPTVKFSGVAPQQGRVSAQISTKVISNKKGRKVRTSVTRGED